MFLAAERVLGGGGEGGIGAGGRGKIRSRLEMREKYCCCYYYLEC